MPKKRIPDDGKIRIELSSTQAEKLGFHVFNYTLKYEINGTKWKKTFKTRAETDGYSKVLLDNNIIPKLVAHRA